jgi:hypothetical protein
MPSLCGKKANLLVGTVQKNLNNLGQAAEEMRKKML